MRSIHVALVSIWGILLAWSGPAQAQYGPEIKKYAPAALPESLPPLQMRADLTSKEEPPGSPEKQPEKTPAKTVEKVEKRMAFEMRAKPWSQVFEWLSDQTGLPFISSHAAPTGTFNFINPRVGGQPRTYTIPEVIDIINEGLISHKYVLIRRPSSFTVVPADEKIDPVLLPRIELDEIEKHGRSEIVQIVLPLQTLVAEDFAPEVKKMMGPFGEVVPLARPNQLVLQDTVGNLKRMLKLVKDIEESEKGQAETYSHKCIYIKAAAAEQVLRNFLGDARQIIEMTRPSTSTGGPSTGPPGFGGPGGFRGDRENRPTTTSKVRIHYITSDERTNTVHINGPPDKIAQAKAVMSKLDVPQYPQQPPLAMGAPQLVTYPVSAGNADALAKTLQEIYKASPSLRISAVSPTQIMVWGGPEEQIDIARHLQGLRPAAATSEMIPLTVLEAVKVAETLKGMFGADPKAGAPYFEGDPSRNVLIVRGSADQVREVKEVVKIMGENPAASGSMRIISLDKGSAVTLAEALQRLLPQMRDNPVKIILPGGESAAPAPVPMPKADPLPGKPKALSPISFEEVGQLVDPAPKGKAGPVKDTKSGPPVVISAFGNKLVILSEDPQAMALVQELVRLLTQTQAGEGDFEIIRLKHANAVDTAAILDEAFNGPKTTTGGGNRGGGRGGQGGINPFTALQGGIGGILQSVVGGSPAGRVERIRVVADPATNSLLVRATPLDMLTIRNLLAKALDTGVTDSNAIAKTYMIRLKNAHAVDVATVIRDVYRDNMTSNAQATRVGGVPGFGFGFANAQVGNQRRDEGPHFSLSVGIDDRSNSLIVSCAPPLYEDIVKLVEQLEEAAADSQQLVKVVPVKGIDPQLVRQAIDAIQGRTTTRPSSGVQGGGFNGSGGTAVVPGIGPDGRFFLQGGAPGRVGPGTGGFPGGAFPITPGGRTPGGGPGGGRRRSGADLRGPDFFGHTVKDDRQETVLFDPIPNAGASVVKDATLPGNLKLVSYQEPEKDKKDDKSPSVNAPRLPVNVEALEQLGVIVIRANNPADLEAALRLIEFIQRVGSGAEIDIQSFALQHADPTSVVTILNQLFSRVQLSPNATTQITAPPRTGGLGATLQPGAGQPGIGGATAQAAAPLPTSVVLIPLPRQNSILVAAPKVRMLDIQKEMQRLDQPIAANARAVTFALKRATASRVAQLILNFYADRYPTEQRTQHQIRVTYDENSNRVFVQASPADLDEIRQLIEQVDTTTSNAVNDLKIVPLKNAVAEDLATLLMRAIADGLSQTSSGAPGVLPQAPGGGGGLGGLGGVGQGLGQGGTGQGGLPQPTRATRVSSLRFLINKKEPGAIETGILDDIRITADPRTNSLMIAAPEKTMHLILALVRELDVQPNTRAEINIFTLKRADAAQLAATLQQLFLGSGGTGTGIRPAGAVGGQGAVGGPGGALGLTQGGAGLAAGQRPALQLTLGGIGPDGAPLVDLRVTVDERTNSLVVAGSRNDLQIIEALISRLEDADIQHRRNEAFRLRNAQAADVAAALSDFLKKTMDVMRAGNQLTAFQEIQREVVVVAEPISNTLLVSATPQYFDDILRMVGQLDTLPPQVAIQVLVAEVDLADTNEFGVELGLQTPVLFRRGIIPDPSALGGGSISYSAATTGTSLLPQGVTVSSTINPAANPGFNFNNVLQPLGNNPIVSPGVVGYQGLGNLGVGRISPQSNIGGFVFSAASDSVSLLIRALKTQNRIDVLSRPQVMTLDNQTALINVGQEIPIVTSSNVTATGIVTTNIDRRNVGVILQVTPRITPDGRVLMRVIPEVSSVVPQPVLLGNGNVGTALNIQHLETTVSAHDGETIILGGMISKKDNKNENKIPWLGDLPYLGSMFRYRTQYRSKTELIVILTPHVVRNKADGERVLAEEARKMDWVLGDVLKLHGSQTLEGLRPQEAAPLVPPGMPAPIVGPGIPIVPSGPAAAPLEEAPRPRVLPQADPKLKDRVKPLPMPPAPMPPAQGRVEPNLHPSGAMAPFPAQVPAGVPVNRLTSQSAVLPELPGQNTSFYQPSGPVIVLPAAAPPFTPIPPGTPGPVPAQLIPNFARDNDRPVMPIPNTSPAGGVR